MDGRNLDDTGGTWSGRVATTDRDTQRLRDRLSPRLKLVLWALLGILVVVAAAYLIKPSSTTSKRGGFGAGPMPVGVAKAISGDIHVTLNALGSVTPLASVTVRPQVSGEISKITFTEGQMVKAGDVLALIDPRTYQAAVGQAQGALVRDAAALANAKVDAQRYQSLYDQKAISQQTLATQLALVKQDEGVVVADQAAVKAADVNLGYTKITSPVTGQAGLRQVDVGNLVTAGQTNQIVTIAQVQPISVLFSLPEDNVSAIMQQVHAGAVLSVDAYDRGQTNKLASGKLSAVDNQIDPTTGTVKLRALFDNSDGTLFANQFVNARLLVQTLHNQTIVPSAAIQRGAEGSYVFVVNTDKTVSMRTVTLGPVDGNNVAITKGLKPGDTVVVDGADRLRDGADITIPAGKTMTITAPSSSGASGGGDDAARAARRAKMAAVMKQYCSADIAKYCPKLQPGTPEMRACFFQNMESFSDTCREQLSKLRGGHHRGGGGGGFGGGGR
ncbi:MAG TPA: efflux RND transporter periplasmic adaptor subunit [Rhizomicrobium sp.]|jgi:multidrug efflux system membrane fusion protein